MNKIAEQGEYRLEVKYDDEAESPRTSCDNFGKMVCFHSKYSLGDKHDYKDKDAFLLALLTETLGSDDKAEQFIEKAEKSLDGKRMGWQNYEKKLDELILAKIEEKHVVLPLYLYDHSGITMNTTGFACNWDSGLVGWTFAHKNEVLKEFGGKVLTAKRRENAENVLRGEVEYYDCYLNGDCYGFELSKNGEIQDSCWGFIGDYDDILQDIEGCLPKECKGMVEKLETPEQRQSVQNLLAKAKAKAASPLPVMGAAHTQSEMAAR